MVKTWTGAIASIMVIAIVFMFGLLKLEFMFSRQSPDITTNIELTHDGAEIIYETG